MKELIFKWVLFFHVLAGALALISGMIAMVSRKFGGRWHKRNGQVFYWSMAFILITAIVFVVLYPEQVKYHFFLMIGVVSFYPAYSGKRMLSMKKEISPKRADWVALGLAALSGVLMWFYALRIEGGGIVRILFFVFGGVLLFLSYSDFKLFRAKQATKMYWLFSHAGKMIGSYSAAVTAFCVNVLPRFLPEGQDFMQVLLWVMPGIVFGIVSSRVRKKYRLRFLKE
ncbi:hypothetical protein LAG90_10320 [Marinilongibacter aquaticus]|uniref:hypothetical protein n=1 Tax=Marinilongibacter aquaticus TaxID=2975157 RepID=UPI0021BD31FB|nr:hypothetical protein [Marinilongibacter aquaticus]UBM57215.1 hypothetical protein LAG90_10320 [Marinilongibacter aquaticus]